VVHSTLAPGPDILIPFNLVKTIDVEQLEPDQLDLIRPLLVELHLEEQGYFEDHPQMSRLEVEAFLGPVSSRFRGENVIYAARDEAGELVGFCWVVLFDPGTGLEGEVAELYVDASSRGAGVGQALVGRAVKLFRERGVTLGYVWTREENRAATRLYRGAGFAPTQQLVLTWYPEEG
jgi:ribosomal protein S18 acetylase RimI-like enzyme